MASYRVELRRADNTWLADLSNFMRLEYARSVGQVGSASLTLPIGALSEVDRDIRMYVYRSPFGNSGQLEGNTPWFLTGIDMDLEEGSATFRFKDALHLLERRIVAYSSETTQADKTIDEGSSGPAGLLMYQYVNENLGSGATDAARNMGGVLTISSTTLGPVVEKQAAWANVLSTLTDISNMSEELGDPVYFDVNGGSALNFDVFSGCLGVDRTLGVHAKPVIFRAVPSEMAGTRVYIEYGEEANVAYVGGYGNGADRLVVDVYGTDYNSADPMGRREIFVDARDYDADSVLILEGQAALAKRKARWKLEGDIVDAGRNRYGVDFWYGDKVTVEAINRVFDCHVNSIAVSVDRTSGIETEEVTIRLQGEERL